MELGLLPALGGSLAELKRSGQHTRLIEGYLRPYARALGRVTYFSYAPELLADYTADTDLAASLELLAPAQPQSRLVRAVAMPVVHREAFRRCAVLRVFQITGVIPALMARAWFGVPYVTTYGFWYSRLSRPGPRRLAQRVVEWIGLKRAAAVIATTEELAARAARVARRVELIPNGVDTRHFTPPPTGSGGECPGPRRILYVGRLSAEKNLSALIRAAAVLAGRLPLRLVMVGSGPLEAPLRAEAAGAGVELDLRGVVDQRALPAVYAAADAFVLASFTEGHPKVLLEAMSAALPCVASDCAGNRSLIRDGVTGLLFDPRRPEQLAACLERVLADPSLAASLGKAARDLIVARYDLSALVEREIALLQAVGQARG